LEQMNELSFSLDTLAAIPGTLLPSLRELTIVLEPQVVRHFRCGWLANKSASVHERGMRQCFNTLVAQGICGVVRKMNLVGLRVK